MDAWESGDAVSEVAQRRHSPMRDSLLHEQAPARSRYLARALIAVVALLTLAWIGYETFVAPSDQRLAWTPPAGLSAAETPHWLQTLCADRTPELCAAGDHARTASDCDTQRAALRALQAVERKLAARGALTSRQHWVLVELYGQGNELCEFEPAAPAGDRTK